MDGLVVGSSYYYVPTEGEIILQNLFLACLPGAVQDSCVGSSVTVLDLMTWGYKFLVVLLAATAGGYRETLVPSSSSS